MSKAKRDNILRHPDPGGNCVGTFARIAKPFGVLIPTESPMETAAIAFRRGAKTLHSRQAIFPAQRSSPLGVGAQSFKRFGGGTGKKVEVFLRNLKGFAPTAEAEGRGSRRPWNRGGSVLPPRLKARSVGTKDVPTQLPVFTSIPSSSSGSLILFLGVWEHIYNPGFNSLEFEGIKNEAGLVLSNLESLNSVLIRQGLPAPDRLLNLNEIAIGQLRTLLSADVAKRLPVRNTSSK